MTVKDCTKNKLEIKEETTLENSNVTIAGGDQDARSLLENGPAIQSSTKSPATLQQTTNV